MSHPILLKRFTQLTGRSADEVRKKVSRGTWVLGVHVVKDPEGKLNVIWEAYQKWVGIETKESTSPVIKFKDKSNGKVSKRRSQRKINPDKV